MSSARADARQADEFFGDVDAQAGNAHSSERIAAARSRLAALAALTAKATPTTVA